MKARHLFVAAALFAGLFAIWMIGTTPMPTTQADAQPAPTFRPF